MAIEFVPHIEATQKKIKSVTVRMDGEDEELLFRVEPLGSRVLIEPENFYISLNQLLQNYDKASQRRLYLAFAKLHYNCRYANSTVDVLESTAELIDEIFSVVTWDGVAAWARSGLTRFVVPERLTDQENNDASRYHPSSSYSPGEYLELCGLATVLKLLTPFWGLVKDINTVHGYTGKTLRRYYLGNIILENSDLTESSAVSKLIEQIVYKLGLDNDRNTVTVPMGLVTDGITVSKYPYVIFTHLMLHDLASSETDLSDRGNGIANNISAKLSGAIIRCITDTKREAYKDKPSGSERDMGEGGNTTNQEMYDIAEVISSEHTVSWKWVLSNLEEVIDRSKKFYSGEVHPDHEKYVKRRNFMKYDYDKDTRDQMREGFAGNKPSLRRVQRTIIGIILDDVVFIDALPYGTGNGLFEARLICAAFTYKHGWHQLTQALLSTVDVNPSYGQIHNHIKDYSPVTENLATFLTMYEEDYTGHPGTTAIEDLINKLFEHNWVCYAPTELGAVYSYGTEWVPEPTIKDELIDLIVYLYN